MKSSDEGVIVIWCSFHICGIGKAIYLADPPYFRPVGTGDKRNGRVKTDVIHSVDDDVVIEE